MFDVLVLFTTIIRFHSINGNKILYCQLYLRIVSTLLNVTIFCLFQKSVTIYNLHALLARERKFLDKKFKKKKNIIYE